MDTLNAGEPVERANIAVLAPGTGLGEAFLTREGKGYRAHASEGGHADFGPRDAMEDRLVRFVRKRFGRVDRDRLLSGEGLTHLYDFLISDGFAP